MDHPGERLTAHLDGLLLKSSRTFALSIPLLPDPTRREVTVAYLLFRIADTFEDANRWPRDRRRAALAEFVGLLEDPMSDQVTALTRSWCADAPLEHTGYVELLEETPSVLAAFAALDPAAREQVHGHTERTARGMSRFVAQSTDSGALHLDTLEELRDYCYVVAGIVGEMLTELFILGHKPAAARADDLRSLARPFGEGLQLVNILKDSVRDSNDGRSYLPPGIDRDAIFELARQDLDHATTYTRTLQDTAAPRGMVAFNALPVLLARATLDRVERDGAGSKLTRPEVFGIIARMNRDLEAGQPAIT